MDNIREKVPGGRGLQNAAQVKEKIQAARKAQGLWEAVPYGERARRLKKAAGYLGDHFDELTELIHRENGKVKIDALAAEVLPAVMALSYYINWGKKFLAPRPLRGGNLLMFNKKSRMIYKPYGVVGIISPWNYPFAIPFSEVVMALLAGNAVILKVASDTPGVGRALEAVFAAAALPEDLFSYIEMPGKEAGPAFITGGVDKLFFTGSTAVGRQLLALAAPRLLPLVLELGGADAAVICADADLDRAAAGILWSGFSNAGQSCGGAQRILVHRAVYEAFLKKLCGLVQNLRVGEDGDMGPMTTLRQKQAVQKQVEACIAGGARIAAQSPGGGFQDESLFVPALVLTGVKETMPVMAEEIFGPVVAVVPVEDDDEALRIANGSSYGLTGSVWSRNHRRAKKLAARINAGAVMINDHLMSHGLAETPWGGFGDSGLGRTHGEAGFREMLKAQVVVDELLPGIKRNLWWQPYSEQTYQGIRAITELLAGTTPGRRLKALPRVIKLVFRYWEK
ncbi:MAG: aldehyde dehydrogenase family protein [Spirochaetaceae bacterium]|nr:aldehyde dehydrogenase family protein [Spirochaetaceae bacterium]